MAFIWLRHRGPGLVYFLLVGISLGATTLCPSTWVNRRRAAIASILFWCGRRFRCTSRMAFIWLRHRGAGLVYFLLVGISLGATALCPSARVNRRRATIASILFWRSRRFRRTS